MKFYNFIFCIFLANAKPCEHRIVVSIPVIQEIPVKNDITSEILLMLEMNFQYTISDFLWEHIT